ncbi:MAG: ferredoxin [Mycobacterium sp.]|jgi:ferredoxin
MHVFIDSEACQGHGRCYALAPEVYTADDEGRGEVIDGEIGEDLVDQARAGAMNCPESAITLT